MSGKPIAWFCVAFILFAVTTGPAFLGILQEKRQLSRRVGELQEQINSSKQERASQLEKQAKKQQKLEQELTNSDTQLQTLKSELAKLQAHRSYQRQMQMKLERAVTRIDQLEAEARKADVEQEVELRKRIAAVRTYHAQAESTLDELIASEDPSTWDQLQQQIDSNWKELSVLLKGDGSELAANLQ